MKTPRFVLMAAAIASLGLAAAVHSPTAIGQDQQGPPPPQFGGGPGGPPPPQFGGPGRGGGFGGGGFRGGQFGGGRAPFAAGTVTAVDPTAKTITITPQFGNGGASQTIQVSDTTQIASQAAATVADLKVGDHVQIQGVPTGITASSVTIGQNPLMPAGGGRQGGSPGFGGPGRGGFGGPGGQASFATASGSVMATNPLTISLGSGVSLTLKLDANAKVTKFSTVTLSDIKVGDRVMSTGQAGDNGTFTASTVGVNLQMGGGPGGGGFSGRGGFGPGGFGQGGRGRRGGQGGFGGGQFPGGQGQGGPFPGGQGGGGGPFPGGQGGDAPPPPGPDDGNG